MIVVIQRSSNAINGSHNMKTRKTLNLSKIAKTWKSWEVNTKISVQQHLKDGIAWPHQSSVLEDSILPANFSYVGHNVEFQLLDISLFSANFIINLLQIESNMNVIGGCRSSRIHEFKLSAIVEDTCISLTREVGICPVFKRHNS